MVSDKSDRYKISCDYFEKWVYDTVSSWRGGRGVRFLLSPSLGQNPTLCDKKSPILFLQEYKGFTGHTKYLSRRISQYGEPQKHRPLRILRNYNELENTSKIAQNLREG
jgi:hypothetical protein